MLCYETALASAHRPKVAAGAELSYLEAVLPMPIEPIYPWLIAGYPILSIHLPYTQK